MGNSFDALAKRLASLAEVPRDVLESVAPDIEKYVRRAGRDGGSLKTGNAVVVKVSPGETRIDIDRVASKDGIPYGPNELVWQRLIAYAASEAVKKRLGK